MEFSFDVNIDEQTWERLRGFVNCKCGNTPMMMCLTVNPPWYELVCQRCGANSGLHRTLGGAMAAWNEKMANAGEDGEDDR